MAARRVRIMSHPTKPSSVTHLSNSGDGIIHGPLPGRLRQLTHTDEMIRKE